MGFLRSGGNIILDAVLTDAGRQLLARNDGSFSIQSFGLSDSEVDYGMIARYGQAVGNEKIIKNTPVHEAITNSSIETNSRLMSLQSQNVMYLPHLSLSTSSNNINLGVTGRSSGHPTSFQTTVQAVLSTSTNLDAELSDKSYVISVDDDLLTLNGSLQYVSPNGQASYAFTNGVPTSSANGTYQITFTVSVRQISPIMFSIKGNNSVITTYVHVVGSRSGMSIDIPVYIYND